MNGPSNDSDEGTDTQDDAPIAQRYPELADIDRLGDDRKLEVYRSVLESLQRELDSSRE